MNVYDEANNLARALKESTEYKNFVAAKEKLETHLNSISEIAEIHVANLTK